MYDICGVLGWNDVGIVVSVCACDVACMIWHEVHICGIVYMYDEVYMYIICDFWYVWYTCVHGMYMWSICARP